MALQAIRYSRAENSLALLDQRLLPGQMVYVPVAGAEAAHAAIRDMLVRGAPAIAIAAALAVAVELPAAAQGFATGAAAASFVAQKLDYLVTSRPTAVNLAEIAGRLKRVAAAAAGGGPAAVVASVVRAPRARGAPPASLTSRCLTLTDRRRRRRAEG
jgi:methylthioribose-1-phosphate isomerase